MSYGPYELTEAEIDRDDKASCDHADMRRDYEHQWELDDRETVKIPPIIHETLGVIVLIAGLALIPFFFAALGDALN